MSPRRTPSAPDSDDDRFDELLERIERLEERTGLSTTAPDGARVSFGQLLAVGLTRRQALAALGFVAAGATTAAAIGRSVTTVEADDEDGEPDELESMSTAYAEIEELVADEGEVRRLEAIDSSVVPRYESEDEMLDLTDSAGSLGLIETQGGKHKLKWRTEDT
jgi:hypothetical protein